MQAAFEAAFRAVLANYTDESGVGFYTTPYAEGNTPVDESLGYYLQSHLTFPGVAPTTSLADIAARTSSILGQLYLSFLSTTNGLAQHGTTNISAQLGFANGRTLRGALDDQGRDLWSIRTVVSNMTFYTEDGSSDLRVYDAHVVDYLDHLYDVVLSISDKASGLLEGQDHSQVHVVSNLDEVISRLDTGNGYLYEIDEFVTDDSFSSEKPVIEFETNQVDLVQPRVALVDESSLDEDFDAPDLDSSPIITLWEDVELGNVVIPSAQIDLSDETMSPGVAMMGKISSTLWWLAYYTGIALLLRREFVYYTSLGSTEGAS